LWVGIALRETGQTAQSLAHIQKSLAIQQEIAGRDKTNFGEQNSLADCYLELGMTQAKQKLTDAAIASYKKAIENYETVWQTDKQNLSVRRQIFFAKRQFAVTLLDKGDIKKAFETFNESLAASAELTAADPNNTEWQYDSAVCHLRIGELFLKQNDKKQALLNFESALPTLEKLQSGSPENFRQKKDLEIVENHIAKLKS
jgi:tetratricopeptide (TPR) repeat protein